MTACSASRPRARPAARAVPNAHPVPLGSRSGTTSPSKTTGLGAPGEKSRSVTIFGVFVALLMSRLTLWVAEKALALRVMLWAWTASWSASLTDNSRRASRRLGVSQVLRFKRFLKASLVKAPGRLTSPKSRPRGGGHHRVPNERGFAR